MNSLLIGRSSPVVSSCSVRWSWTVDLGNTENNSASSRIHDNRANVLSKTEILEVHEEKSTKTDSLIALPLEKSDNSIAPQPPLVMQCVSEWDPVQKKIIKVAARHARHADKSDRVMANENNPLYNSCRRCPVCKKLFKEHGQMRKHLVSQMRCFRAVEEPWMRDQLLKERDKYTHFEIDENGEEGNQYDDGNPAGTRTAANIITYKGWDALEASPDMPVMQEVAQWDPEQKKIVKKMLLVTKVDQIKADVKAKRQQKKSDDSLKRKNPLSHECRQCPVCSKSFHGHNQMTAHLIGREKCFNGLEEDWMREKLLENQVNKKSKAERRRLFRGAFNRAREEKAIANRQRLREKKPKESESGLIVTVGSGVVDTNDSHSVVGAEELTSVAETKDGVVAT